MPLEAASFIAGLDQSWPLGGDPTNQGDDHLRLLKNVLKAQFPGVGAAGFNTAILATEAELNALVGLNTATTLEVRLAAIEASIVSLEGVLTAPVGTRMLFAQASTPLGWTQDVADTGYMLRIVDGAGGGTGGTDNPIENDFVVQHNHAISLTSGIGGGSHGHAVQTNWYQSDNASTGCFSGGPPKSANPFCATDTNWHTALNTNIDHTHAVNGNTANTGAATGWRPKYSDAIIGVKD